MPDDSTDALHKTGAKAFAAGSAILVLAFLAINVARIASVAAENGETPFLSANDRSRWCNIASLLEDHTYAIDRFLDIRDSKGKTRTWYSIDMVRHRDQNGTEHYYSSKPPLLTLAYTAGTWPVMVATQRRLSEHPMLVGRIALLLINIPAMIIFAIWWRQTLIRKIENPWAQWLLLVGGLFGTFLTTFTVTLNNHIHAAVCLVITLVLMQRILLRRASAHQTSDNAHSSLRLLIALGFFAGCCFMCEMPALAWAAIIPLVIFDRRTWLKDWSAYCVGLVPVLAAIVGVNWYAHGDWRPPYYHREALGEQLLAVSSDKIPLPQVSTDLHTLDAAALNQLASSFDSAEVKDKLHLVSPITVEHARRSSTLRLQATDAGDAQLQRRFALVIADGQWSIHQWNDWYDYPRSYWLPENKRGVDIGEKCPYSYAWNCLFGHHGVFSLTPLFLLSIPGAWIAVRKGDSSTKRLALGIVAVSVICMTFYLTRNQLDRNYGGVASGFRWQFFLIPAWLWLGLHVFTDRFTWYSKSWTRRIVELLLIISLFSAWYPAANPWQHPWMYQWYLWAFAS
jgi:hypothetical protein